MARVKVVLIHDETPRTQWKLEVIIQLHRGKDGLVRSVTLRKKGNLISRPIEKLYPLEVLAQEDNLQDSPWITAGLKDLMHNRDILKIKA